MKLSSKSSLGSREVDADLPLRRTVASVTEALHQLVRVNRRLNDEHFTKHVLLRIQHFEEQLLLLTQGKLVFDSTVSVAV